MIVPELMTAPATGIDPLTNLLPLAEAIALRLKARSETIAVAESSTGGLISAALLAVPGASAYFLGGAVAYTRLAKRLLLADEAELEQFRSATEPHALLLARRARAQFAATWGLAETGAAGPSGNRYGDQAGHTCLAIAGTAERAVTLETGSADRLANMQAFAAAALKLLADTLAAG